MCEVYSQLMLYLGQVPASTFFQVFGPVSMSGEALLGVALTGRPNGWGAPVCCLRGGTPVFGGLDGKEHVRHGNEVNMKHDVATDIIESILNEVVGTGTAKDIIEEVLSKVLETRIDKVSSFA